MKMPQRLGAWTKKDHVTRLKGDRRWLKRCLKEYSLKIIPHFAKTNLQIQEMEQISNMINPKKCVPTHIIVKCLKTENTRSLKSEDRKHRLTCRIRRYMRKGSLKPIISAHTSRTEKNRTKWTPCKQEWILKKEQKLEPTADKNQWNTKLALRKDRKRKTSNNTGREQEREHTDS